MNMELSEVNRSIVSPPNTDTRIAPAGNQSSVVARKVFGSVSAPINLIDTCLLSFSASSARFMIAASRQCATIG